MTKNNRMRWLVLASIWGGVVMLTVWNLEAMTQATAAREGWHRLASVREFLDSRRDDIIRQRISIEAETLLVDSAEIGLLYLERNLIGLAERYDLQEFKFEGQVALARRGSIPLSLAFAAPVSVAHRFLASIPTEFPYLSVSAVEVRSEPGRQVPNLIARLNFKIRTNAPVSRRR